MMRINFTISTFLLTYLLSGCLPVKQANDGLPFIDLSKNYPEKEIILPDIANITYLHLNTDDNDYLYQGQISYITKNTVVVLDRASKSILLFSKDGTPKSRFNRVGQGPKEYIDPTDIIFNESTDEVFVLDFYINVIQVYSSTGEHKRTIKLPQATLIFDIIDFDDHSLFLRDNMNGMIRGQALLKGADVSTMSAKDYLLSFYRVSKTDGEVLDYVELLGTDFYVGAYFMQRWVSAHSKFVVKCQGGVLLNNPQTDTVFFYSGDKSLSPVFYQTPSVISQSPKQYLHHCLDRGQYQFFQFNIMREGANPLRYPAKYYMRNKMTGETVQYKFILPDYTGREFIMNRNHPNVDGSRSDSYKGDIYNDGYWFELDLFELKQAYSDNKLSGKLKDLVETLDEDTDNNVFVLVEFK